ncbi:small ribosomal subunit protein uS11m-like [Amphiura filiformis]|uniref:small ribosomal subunit protein uS11m-like n=1 Tax=Amphiura filiformis TaxID=82378 RepID=UPI003B2228F4
MAANAGKMMYQATRLCIHQVVCRRLLVSSALSARLPSWSAGTAAATANQKTHPFIATACLHTHQRLQQDNTTTDSGSGGQQETPATVSGNSPDQSESDKSISVEDLGLGKTFNVPVTSTDSLVFNGVPYSKLHIATIKASWNNTIITITDHQGRSLKTVSAGSVGLKNAKKGTSVAGQTIGAAAAKVALENGVKAVRVLVKGIGPGRQTSIRGLQVGGLDVVSITDRTGIPQNGDKPRKARRL